MATRRCARTITTSPFKARASRLASASSCTATCSMKTAAACRTRWSNCGRPMPAAVTCMSSISIPRRSIRISPAPAARNRTRKAITASSPSSPAPTPGVITTTPGGRPISTSRCSATPSSRVSSRRCISPAIRLFPFDPIFNSVTDEKARNRMISSFDLENTKPDWALCYRFNIVLRGRNATPMENK